MTIGDLPRLMALFNGRVSTAVAVGLILFHIKALQTRFKVRP